MYFNKYNDDRKHSCLLLLFLSSPFSFKVNLSNLHIMTPFYWMHFAHDVFFSTHFACYYMQCADLTFEWFYPSELCPHRFWLYVHILHSGDFQSFLRRVQTLKRLLSNQSKNIMAMMCHYLFWLVDCKIIHRFYHLVSQTHSLFPVSNFAIGENMCPIY